MTDTQMQRSRAAVGLVTGLFALLLVAGLGAGVASAQTTTTNYTTVATFTLDRQTVQTCGSVTMTGNGFKANSTVNITANGQAITTRTTDASGAFTFTYTLPSTSQPGTLGFNASDGTNSLSATVQVTACASSNQSSSNNSGSGNTGNSGSNAGGDSSSGSGSGTLVNTGARVELLVRIAVLFLAAGGLLLLALRGRDRRTSAA